VTKKKKVEEDDEMEDNIDNIHYMSSCFVEGSNNSFLPSHDYSRKYEYNSKMVKTNILMKRKNQQPLLQTPTSFSDINSNCVPYEVNNSASSTSSNNYFFEYENATSSHFFPLSTKYDQEVYMSQNLFNEQRRLRFSGNFSDSKQLIISTDNNSNFDQQPLENESESSSVSSFITNVSNTPMLSSTTTPNSNKLINGLHINYEYIIILLFFIFSNIFVCVHNSL
jgi:hypothetical protein